MYFKDVQRFVCEYTPLQGLVTQQVRTASIQQVRIAPIDCQGLPTVLTGLSRFPNDFETRILSVTSYYDFQGI